eukprot:scaffold25553_cov127-Cylindrotheca_fusiformis.AAC.1
MNRLELEHQKSSQVQGKSHQILQLTRSTSDTSFDEESTKVEQPFCDGTATPTKNSKPVVPYKGGGGLSRNEVYKNHGKASFQSPQPGSFADVINNEEDPHAPAVDVVDEGEEEVQDRERLEPYHTPHRESKDREASSSSSSCNTGSSPCTTETGKCCSKGECCRPNRCGIEYWLVSLMLFVFTPLMSVYRMNNSKVTITFSNDTSVPLHQHEPPLNDPLMTILWENTLLLEDETASGLSQPPWDTVLYQDLSPQYQAYLLLDRNYGLELPPTQVLLQEYALATLYYSTNGPEWSQNSNWLATSSSNSSVCTWFTIQPSCNRHGRLISLNLDENGLVGRMPPELGMLQDLQEIHLSKNHLTGSLPSSLAKLVRLKTFDISFNLLTSTLPSSYGSWTALEQLKVDHNKLSGTFPSNDYSSWSGIRRLNMEVNHFH